MTVADHIVVGEVGFAAWQSSDAFKGFDLSADVLERTRKAYETFAAEAKGDIWIAERDGRVVGWCARDGERNYISDLWVLPECQGRGIGRALVLYACDRIKADGHEIGNHPYPCPQHRCYPALRALRF